MGVCCRRRGGVVGGLAYANYYFYKQNNPAVPDTGKPDPTGRNSHELDKKKGDPCKGLRDILKEHQDKLQRYARDPYSNDNLGILGRGYDDNIIAGRVKNLVLDILEYQKQLEECESGNGIP